MFNGLRTTGAPLHDGDSVIFIDRKNREYLKTLRAGDIISIRGGTISADNLLGRPDGVGVRSSLKERFVVLRPTLERLIPNLPRKAQVIYPKDLGLILMWGGLPGGYGDGGRCGSWGAHASAAPGCGAGWEAHFF